MTKSAIIYTRFSPRPNAKECDSCEKQEERCIAYCVQHNYHVAYTFSDKDISGGILNRPQLAGMFECLQDDDILVVDSSDRLARDMLVNLTIRQQIADAGATIEYANGSPAGTTPEGKLMENILAAFSAYERDRIRLRTKQGLDRKRKNGERTTSQIPIGWKLDPEDPKRLVRCEQERKAILKLCKRSLEGYSSEDIAIRLNLSIGYCRGKPWSARTVRKIIKREAYWANPVNGDPNLEPSHP